MMKFIITIAIIAAAFWAYTNLDFNKMANDSKSSVENAKIIQTVSDRRASMNEDAENAGN